MSLFFRKEDKMLRQQLALLAERGANFDCNMFENATAICQIYNSLQESVDRRIRRAFFGSVLGLALAVIIYCLIRTLVQLQ